MKPTTVWLFDLDDTLHDARRAVFPQMHAAIGAYVQARLGLDEPDAHALRQRYWKRYGATLLGLVKHHGVEAAHFLAETHALPGLEARLRTSPHDREAVRRLPGRKVVLTNAPRVYALRVLEALHLRSLFDAVIPIEEMTMFGALRPKPDRRMLRAVAARLRVHPSQCVLVEDSLANLKAARALRMRTVWMRRWIAPTHRQRVAKPAYVYARISALRKLSPRR